MGVVIPFPLKRALTVGNPLAMMPWFPPDFLSSTRGWSVTAKGVYRELLDAQWELGDLPEGSEELRVLIGATKAEWKAGWPKCEAKFPLIDGRRRNPRLEEHRSKSTRLSEKRRALGSLGGKASAQARAEAIAQPIATPIAEAIAQATVDSPSPSLKNPDKNPAAPGFSADLTEDSQDPDDYLIWTAGVNLLGAEKRSLLGKLVKTHGRDLVARKLGELMAMTEKPRDPAAYFIGVMRKLERRFQA